MEREAAIEHIQEKLDLLGVGKVPCHRLKHPSDHHREISLLPPVILPNNSATWR